MCRSAALLTWLGLTCFSSYGQAETYLIDSTFQVMSAEERIRQLVWLELSDKTQLSKVAQSNLQKVGAIYLPLCWNSSDLLLLRTMRNKPIALQLDFNLNPAPDTQRNLPNIHTLSAITDDQLLQRYFRYLRSLSIGQGYSYVVLPPNIEKLPAIESLYAKLDSFDHHFFIKYQELNFFPAEKKKDYRKLFEEKEYWIVKPSEIQVSLEKINKWQDKIAYFRLAHRVKYAIQLRTEGLAADPLASDQLSPQMNLAIRKKAVVPLQRMAGTLPLRADTLCFVTEEPFGAMAEILRRYAYLTTSYEGINNSRAPVLVDMDHLPSDLHLSGRMIVYIGKFDPEVIAQVEAALLYDQDHPVYNFIIPQLLFGAAAIEGRFPHAPELVAGFSTAPVEGLGIPGYTPPEEVGLTYEVQQKIESIVTEAVRAGATPGCQIALAVGGSIVMNESYGYLTYDSLLPVFPTTLYDLASITKVSATLLAIMHLYEEGQLALDDRIADHLPNYANSNKGNLTIRALLSHQAGLLPYVPFWRKLMLETDFVQPFYYATQADLNNDRRSYGFKPRPEARDSLNNWIVQSALLKYDSVPYYTYSDIGFMILHQVVESITGESLDTYLDKHFYGPLGLGKVTFNPLEKGFDLFEIAPTEYDDFFREEQVWGEVHDRNAAVFGGVAGHAGLFSNARDLLIVFQMLLQGGTYNGIKFFDNRTLDAFNQRYYENNRRGLGWDKKDDAVGHVSTYTSDRSFGHTGFTGTMVWIDPELDVVFVFLSNRIFPDSRNYKLNQMDIRTRIQDVVYEALLSNW